MEERAREQVAVEEAGEERSELAEALDAISTEPPGSGQRSRATEVNTLLSRVRPGPRAKADAVVLTKHLESGALRGVVDDDGVACRAQAIDALLRLGYPWALTVRPEDLEWFRTHGSRPRRRRRWFVGAAVATAIGLGVAQFSGAFWASPRPVVQPLPPVAPAAPNVSPLEQLMAIPTEATLDGVGLTAHAEAYTTMTGAGTAFGRVSMNGTAGAPLSLLKFDVYDAYTGAQLASARQLDPPSAQSGALRPTPAAFEAVVPAIAVMTVRDSTTGEKVKIRSGVLELRPTEASGGAATLQASTSFGPRGPRIAGRIKSTRAPYKVTLVATGQPDIKAAVTSSSRWNDGEMTFETLVPEFDARLEYRVAVTLDSDDQIWFLPDATHFEASAPRTAPERAVVGGTPVFASVRSLTPSLLETAIEVTPPKKRAPVPKVEVTRVQLFDESGLISEGTAKEVSEGSLVLRYPLEDGRELQPGHAYGLVLDLKVGGKPVLLRTAVRKLSEGPEVAAKELQLSRLHTLELNEAARRPDHRPSEEVRMIRSAAPRLSAEALKTFIDQLERR